MGQLQISSDMSWIEVQFLKNAVDTLSACRQTLKWSYALAYFPFFFRKLT
jgi:ariadne-1